MNIANAVDRFTRQLAANGRSVHTQAAYRRDLEGLGRWMGGKPDVGKITPDLLARFLLCKKSIVDGLSPSFVRRIGQKRHPAIRGHAGIGVRTGYRCGAGGIEGPTTLPAS